MCPAPDDNSLGRFAFGDAMAPRRMVLIVREPGCYVPWVVYDVSHPGVPLASFGTRDAAERYCRQQRFAVTAD